MDTLKSIRSREEVFELKTRIEGAADLEYITFELQKTDGGILVIVNHPDDAVNAVLNAMDPDDTGRMFFASELEMDPINNCMVPRHRMVTEGEIDALLERRIPLDKLPILRMLDPIRRWHNFPKGSIVAIERQGGDVYFRRVL